MRICFVSAGTFTHVGAYLDYFREAGHDVHFVALSPSPPRSVPTHEIGARVRLPLPPRWQYPLALLRVRAAIRRLKPDVVHAQYATSGGAAGLACGFRPLVVTAHGTDLTGAMGSPLRRALLRAVFERAACVNTVSAELTKMAASIGAPAGKIVEMTLGVDTALFQPGARRPPGGGPLRLVCTRRFEAVYGHRTIVEALAILKESGVAFEMTFAGDGSLRAECESLAARRGLAGSVAFVGEVGGGEMPALLRAHDVYLSASLADGTSLSLLEAMACGLFPVVSRIPANSAWLEHGAGGFLHAAGDARGLAASLEELSRRPALAAAAAALNRARVVEGGDRRTNMRRLERVYEGLIARAGAETKALPRGNTAGAGNRV